jgi:VWFA-related protein
LLLALLFISGRAVPQTQQSAPSGNSSSQQVPDAPSAVKPPPPSFPTNVKPQPTTQPAPEPEPPPAEQPDAEAPGSVPDGEAAGGVKAMPARKSKPDEDSRNEFTVKRSVSFVNVPVTVKDGDGNLVEGLTRRDFAVYEDGMEQKVNFFTSEAFPLSAAVVIDTGMSASTMSKVNRTLASITGAFSQYDEVEVYTYASVVHPVTDFRAANDQLTMAMRRAKRTGATGGVPVTGGPMAAGPTVNGHPLDPGAPHVRTVKQDASVLNDAILRAALDLSRRDRSRRRVIFVISDGREDGSDASYAEVLKVLLTNEITVYALGVDGAALPVYEELGRIKLPGQGTGNILPKYVSATGGGFIAALSQSTIDRAYSRLTGQSRNQYTLGYNTSATVASNYRSIEVVVHRPRVRVIARDGYYPLPRPQAGAPPPDKQ